MSKRDSHKQALRQLLDRYISGIDRRDHERLIDEILRIHDRFNSNPNLDEALNSGNGTYKP